MRSRPEPPLNVGMISADGAGRRRSCCPPPPREQSQRQRRQRISRQVEDQHREREQKPRSTAPRSWVISNMRSPPREATLRVDPSATRRGAAAPRQATTPRLPWRHPRPLPATFPLPAALRWSRREAEPNVEVVEYSRTFPAQTSAAQQCFGNPNAEGWQPELSGALASIWLRPDPGISFSHPLSAEDLAPLLGSGIVADG